MYFFKFLPFLAMAVLVSVTSAEAQERPDFQLPIDCTINENCWILNYVDMDTAKDSAKDPFCHARTYDAHKGTDFAIASQAVMEEGVDVLAAKAGKIEKVRDGEIDRYPTEEDLEASKEAQKECGNAILIDHGSGLKTLYCHLKQNSITVKPGQEVEAGAKIAQVGLSGYTQFPHVHFGVLWEGAVIDPFTGYSNMKGCGEVKNPLWHPDSNITYTPTVLYSAGFHNAAPELSTIDNGLHNNLSYTTEEPALVFWFVGFGVREGDKIALEITAPDGTVFSRREVEQPKTRTRQFYYAGKKITDTALKQGTYKGKATLIRHNELGEEDVYTIERDIRVQ